MSAVNANQCACLWGVRVLRALGGRGEGEEGEQLLIRIVFFMYLSRIGAKQSRKEAAKLYLPLAAVLAWGCSEFTSAAHCVQMAGGPVGCPTQ